MPENLGYLPSSVVAGETIWVAAANTTQGWATQDIILTDYTPAGGYTLAYQFNAGTPISVSAAANGANTGWTLTVTAAQTLLWTAGIIRFVGLVTETSSGKVFAVDAGTIDVTGSPLAVSAYQTALTAIEAAIATFATSPSRSFQVGDLQVSYGSIQELIDLRTFYRAEVARTTGKRIKRVIHSRFT